MQIEIKYLKKKKNIRQYILIYLLIFSSKMLSVLQIALRLTVGRLLSESEGCVRKRLRLNLTTIPVFARRKTGKRDTLCSSFNLQAAI